MQWNWSIWVSFIHVMMAIYFVYIYLFKSHNTQFSFYVVWCYWIFLFMWLVFHVFLPSILNNFLFFSYFLFSFSGLLFFSWVLSSDRGKPFSSGEFLFCKKLIFGGRNLQNQEGNVTKRNYIQYSALFFYWFIHTNHGCLGLGNLK